jgi:hypothetical protein
MTCKEYIESLCRSIDVCSNTEAIAASLHYKKCRTCRILTDALMAKARKLLPKARLDNAIARGVKVAERAMKQQQHDPEAPR